jgi:autophagy-related protein 5
LIVPRVGYFALYVPHVLQRLVKTYLVFLEAPTEIWFSYEQVPLPWYYPVGLVYDLCAAMESDTVKLPWKVTVHTRDYPHDRLVQSSDTFNVYSHFMSLIKQADYIQCGSTKHVMRLSKEDQESLWQAVTTRCTPQISMVEMNETSGKTFEVAMRIKALLTVDKPKSLPTRVYVVQDRTWTVVQEVVPVEATLLELKHLLNLPHSTVCVVHGIQHLDSTRLATLVRWLSFADQFLHVVLATNRIPV